MVATELLKLAMETDGERKARLKKMVATTQLRLAPETEDDRRARLWFCFLLHSILFLISQTSYRTYKIISSYELARPVMGTIFLVYIYICMYVVCIVFSMVRSRARL